MLYDRNGVPYVAVDDQGAPLRTSSASQPVSLGPPGLRMLSNRGLFLIYRVSGALGGTVKDPAGNTWSTIRITDATPVIHIPGKVIDGMVQSTVWEGAVTKRISAGTWDPQNTTPIRISFSSVAHNTFVFLWAQR